MTPLLIAGIGICATGMANWTQARSVLRSAALPVLEPLPRLAPDCLPPVERRRANATTRLAISATLQAVRDMPDDDIAQLPTVFSSSDGDGEVLASMLAALAQPQVSLSPTLFHNSVFNAPSGYWSIGSRARVPSITVSAGAASFVAGLMEAHSQVCATGRCGAVCRLRRAVSRGIGVVRTQCRTLCVRVASRTHRERERMRIRADREVRSRSGNAAGTRACAVA